MSCLGIHRERPWDPEDIAGNTNHAQETLLVHMPGRLQGTQEATAAFVHSADLGLLQQRIGSAGMIRSGKDSGSAYLTGG